MIQRIQSIWLLFAAIAILCLLFIPAFGAANAKEYFILYGTGLKTEGTNNLVINYPLLISTVLGGLISLVNIFNFRNRKLQIRIATINILLILALSFFMFLLIKGISGLTTLDVELGIFLPLAAIIFTLLAIRGIKNDEKLIRSADRLR